MEEGDTKPEVKEEVVNEEIKEPEPTKEEVAKSAFAEALPDYAGLYDDLSPDARAGMLVAHLAKSSVVTEPEGTRTKAPGAAKSPPGTPSPQPSQDTNMPSADATQAEQEELAFWIEQGLDEPAAQRRAKIVGDRMKRDAHLGDLVVKTLEEFETEAIVPVRWLTAMRTNPEATESDLKAAKEIVKTSPTTDLNLALELAVARRASKAKTEQGAPATSEKIRKLVAAMQAAQLTGSGPRGGAPVEEPEDSDEFMRTLREKEEAEENKK